MCLRQFASHVTAADRSCRSAAAVTAGHVTGWEVALSAPGAADGRADGDQPRPSTTSWPPSPLLRAPERVGPSRCPAQMPIARPPRRPPPPKATKPATKRPRPPQAPKPAKPKPPSRAFPIETTWEQIAARAPQLAATMCAYLEQLTVSHRPSSVAAAGSLALRHLAAHLVATDPTLSAVARGRAAATSSPTSSPWWPGPDGKGLSPITTVRHNLAHAALVLRADHRMGLGRRPPAAADLRRGCPQSRRPSAEDSWTTRPRRSSWPPWPPTRTGDAG